MQICQVEPLGLEPVTCSHNGAIQLSFLPWVHLVDLLWIYQYVVKAHCQQVTLQEIIKLHIFSCRTQHQGVVKEPEGVFLAQVVLKHNVGVRRQT